MKLNPAKMIMQFQLATKLLLVSDILIYIFPWVDSLHQIGWYKIVNIQCKQIMS